MIVMYHQVNFWFMVTFSMFFYIDSTQKWLRLPFFWRLSGTVLSLTPCSRQDGSPMGSRRSLPPVLLPGILLKEDAKALTLDHIGYRGNCSKMLQKIGCGQPFRILGICPSPFPQSTSCIHLYFFPKTGKDYDVEGFMVAVVKNSNFSKISPVDIGQKRSIVFL